MNFKDHFSSHSADYRRARPTYPEELYTALAKLTPSHELAWDCATGNGQAAVELAKYFKKVIATDASEEQIRHAQSCPNVEYRVAPAENSGLDNQSADLVTVAQALHWFDFDKFYREAKRVLKPKGIIAAWCYLLFETDDPEITDLIKTFYWDIIGSYWPKERKYLENNYEDIPFPFKTIPPPDIAMHLHWNMQQMVDYLNTWSGVKRYESEKGENPVLAWFKPRLEKLWENPEKLMKIHYPLVFKVGINS